MQHNYNSEDLINRYKSGTCSLEEKAIVESWHIKMLAESDFMPDEEELNRAGKAIWAALPLHEGRHTPKKMGLWLKYAAAAVLLVVSAGLYFVNFKGTDASKQPSAARYKNDVNPGGNKAILVLADGKKVVLDDAKDGLLAREGKAMINKTADGQLTYHNQQEGAAVMNKLSTPKGGQYQVVLPDGSKVWLNSASTLTFPTAFTGGSRDIQLSGEAYFEVAKNKVLPFKVHTDKQVVEVLGTHFNVNSYAGETTIKTTLLEGSVKVAVGGKDYLLKPGQQASVGNRVKIINADVDQAVAWMNGDFNFKDENIHSIMRKLERWYDIEVVYKGEVSDIDFGAEISRSRSLSQVLTILEETGGVHFKIEGRRVTVMP